MDNLRGSLFMVLAMALFAVEDALIKQASQSLPVGQILLIIGILGTAVFMAVARYLGVRLWTRVLLHPAIMVRNLAELLGTMAFVVALSRIPLGTAAAIIQATPLLLTLGAALILRETVGWRRWTAIAIGLFGVLLILRPGLDGFDPNVFYAVIGVICLAARDLGARYVPRDISNVQLSAYGFASAAPGGVLLLMMTGPAVAMAWSDIGVMLGVVCVGVFAYFTVTLAARTGDISVVAPFRYTRLIFAMLLGMAFFAETPDALTLTGAAIVMTTGLYTLMREARLRSRNSA